jgi:hypothetical protein
MRGGQHGLMGRKKRRIGACFVAIFSLSDQKNIPFSKKDRL